MTPQDIKEALGVEGFSDERKLNSDELKPLIVEYARYRVRGFSTIKSFRIVFGFDGDTAEDHQRSERIECTKTYLRLYDEQVDKLSINAKFESKRIAAKLLETIESRTVTDAGRMKAIEQYIILAGIGELDDNGKLKLKSDSTTEALTRIAAALDKGQSVAESDVVRAVLSKLGIDPDTFDLAEFMSAPTSAAKH